MHNYFFSSSRRRLPLPFNIITICNSIRETRDQWQGSGKGTTMILFLRSQFNSCGYYRYYFVATRNGTLAANCYVMLGMRWSHLSLLDGRTDGWMDEMIRYSRKILFSYWFLSRWIIDKRKICTLVSIYPPPPLPHCASSRHHHQLCHLVPFYTEDDTITWVDRARQMEMLSGGDFLLQQQFLPEITIYHWLAS